MAIADQPAIGVDSEVSARGGAPGVEPSGGPPRAGKAQMLEKNQGVEGKSVVELSMLDVLRDCPLISKAVFPDSAIPILRSPGLWLT